MLFISFCTQKACKDTKNILIMQKKVRFCRTFYLFVAYTAYINVNPYSVADESDTLCARQSNPQQIGYESSALAIILQS